METILGLKKRIQFGVNLMSHIMLMVFVPLSVNFQTFRVYTVCTDCNNSCPLVLCSSQWTGGNGGEEGDKTAANTKGESKIAPKVQTRPLSRGGKLLARVNKHSDGDSSVVRSLICYGHVIVVLRSPPRRHRCPRCPWPFKHVGCQTPRPHREVSSVFPSLSIRI